jgi:predicted Zn-dependent peptidase
MILSICGDTDLDTIVSAVDEVFCEANPSVKAFSVKKDKSLFDDGVDVFKHHVDCRMEVSRPILSIGYKICDKENDPVQRQINEVALMIINEFLFSHSGDLYNELYSKGLVSSYFAPSLTYTKDFSSIILCTETDQPDIVCDSVREYVKGIIKEGIPKEDIARCRRVIYSEFIAAFDSSEEISEMIIDATMSGADLFGYSSIAREISDEAVNVVLRELISDRYVSDAVILPLR